MLLESTIDKVVGGVKKCPRRLIMHGADVVRDDLVTANKPFAPSAAPAPRTPPGALKQDDAPRPSSVSSPSSPFSGASSSSMASDDSSEASVPGPSQSSPSPPSSSSDYQPDVDDDDDDNDDDSEASVPAPSQSSLSPLLSSSDYQPDVVALDWRGGGPRNFFGSKFIQVLEAVDQAKRDFTFLHILDMKQVTGTNAGEVNLLPAIHLVVWCCSNHVLELQADISFTKAAVMNAFAREIALNSARAMLLAYVEESHDEQNSWTPKGVDDPAVVQFLARFRANLVALVEEASSAPVAFSMSHSLLPDDVEDQIREEVALNRRRRVDLQEYWRLSAEYKAAMQAYESAGGGACVSPAPAGDMAPEKHKYPSESDPTSPDPLAGCPPPPGDAPDDGPLSCLHGRRNHGGVQEGDPVEG